MEVAAGVAKIGVLHRAYEGVNQSKKSEEQSNDSDDDGDQQPLRRHKKHEAHDVGPARRNLALWSSNLQTYIEKTQERGNMEKDIQEVFKYGKYIGRDRFKTLLKVLSKGDPVEEIEVDWILYMVDTDGTGGVSRNQLGAVKCALATYILARNEVEELFSRFSKDKSGLLSREEVRSLLTSLNNGIRCTDDELSWVIKAASKFRHGAIVKPELQAAINFWYTNVHPPAAQDLSIKRVSCKGGAVGRIHAGMVTKQADADKKLRGSQGSSAIYHTSSKTSSPDKQKYFGEYGDTWLARYHPEMLGFDKLTKENGKTKQRASWEDHFGVRKLWWEDDFGDQDLILTHRRPAHVKDAAGNQCRNHATIIDEYLNDRNHITRPKKV